MNDIFVEYRNKTIGDFEIRDPSHSQAVEAVKKYMEAIKDHRKHAYGLFLTGPSGVGKTFLASMVLKCAQAEGFSIEAMEFATYVNMHHRMFRYDSQVRAGYSDAVEDFHGIDVQVRRMHNRIDFVLFDDIGREHESGSGWSNEQLFDIFRYRFNRGKPTIFTTNKSMPELKSRYSEGFTSLLHGATRIILVEGEDYRCVEGN